MQTAAYLIDRINHLVVLDQGTRDEIADLIHIGPFGDHDGLAQMAGSLPRMRRGGLVRSSSGRANGRWQANVVRVVSDAEVAGFLKSNHDVTVPLGSGMHVDQECAVAIAVLRAAASVDIVASLAA